MRRRTLKSYTDIIEKLGGEIEEITVAGSTHYRIEVAAGERRKVFIASSSPSDRRGLMNWRSFVRRWIENESNPER
jgi:hypothetical protein